MRALGAGDAELISELIFTSGTEATPKAIMHTEQTANFSVRVAHSDLGITDEDVVWMPSPVGHSTGFNYGLAFAPSPRPAAPGAAPAAWKRWPASSPAARTCW